MCDHRRTAAAGHATATACGRQGPGGGHEAAARNTICLPCLELLIRVESWHQAPAVRTHPRLHFSVAVSLVTHVVGCERTVWHLHTYGQLTFPTPVVHLGRVRPVTHVFASEASHAEEVLVIVGALYMRTVL